MKKRRSGALRSLLAAALLCALMLTGCGTPQAPAETQAPTESQAPVESQVSTESQVPAESQTNYEPEFEKILAMVGLTGDDVITDVYESFYYMTSEETKELIPVMQAFAEEMKAELEEEDRVTVDWEKEKSSFRISYHMMHLDRSENVKDLMNQRLLNLKPGDDGLLHYTYNLSTIKGENYVEQSFYKN